MVRRALDAKADILIFLDYDISFDPQDLVRLIETPGDVVCGTYRFKQDEVKYMGELVQVPCGGGMETPMVRKSDGAIQAKSMPAGFLKVTKEAIDLFMRSYPKLIFGPAFNPSIDLFNHGAHKGVWYGEDYAFCRNWRDIGGEIWCIPDLNVTHHSISYNRASGQFDHRQFPGNFHRHLCQQPGGSLSDSPVPPEQRAALRAA